MLRKALRIGFFAGLLLGAVALWFAFDGYQTATKPGRFSEARLLLVEPGESLAGLAWEMEKEGVIASSRVMRWAAKILDKQALRAGEFEIPARASLIEVLNILHSGPYYQRKLTIPEGLSVKQIMAMIEAEPTLSGAIDAPPEEGSLLPETYLFTRGEPRQALIERMQAAMASTIAELWPERALDLPFDTPQEAVTLASIVEKETGVADERPLVAAVFINRLRKRMRLQSDPTIIYGITQGEPLGRPIRRSEIRRETAYNTYQIRGLPPTPIANPGRSSLAAVLSPADAPYLYFVADGSGGHAFARTLAEHNDNVAAWRRLQRQQRDG